MILLTPIIKILTKWGIHPNNFTLAGVIITSLAAVALMMGHLRAGGVLILAGSLLRQSEPIRCTVRFGD
jgi:hypothetical protein